MDAGLAANFLNKYRNAGVEYSVSLDNENGKYTMTEPYTENKLDNVPLRFGEYTEATVHNHPRSNPPSISDVLTLAKMNKRSDGKFESSFIVPKTGPIYVLQVTNKDKASKFYDLYENKSDELTTKRTEYLAWLVSNGGGTFPEKEFDGYSLAAILQEMDCGISLLQVEGDSRSFKQMEAAVERENGQVSNIVYTICK